MSDKPLQADADPSTFLTRIVAHKQVEIAAARAALPEAALEQLAKAMDAPRPFVLDESGPVAVIAEVKRASPSKGDLAAALDAPTQARAYEEGGAAVVSVLCDKAFYRGSFDDLRAVRAAVATPVLCKDFILDRYGVLQARAAGADLVLLIVAVLGAGVKALMDDVTALGMMPLVEVYTEDEARTALEAGASLIGVNNRNLHTFEVSLDATRRLAPLLAPHATVASLSGIFSAADVAQVVRDGARAVLVGEALVTSADPAALIREFRTVQVAASAAGAR